MTTGVHTVVADSELRFYTKVEYKKTALVGGPS